jgi:alkylation response protein AidB-like acyl-CoA dehydrogenase
MTERFVNDPQFGEIVDFDELMVKLQGSYDAMFPEYNMLESVRVGSRAYDDQPSYMTAGGASILAYSMLLAAEEPELAAELKGKLFTLGWTEEHTGTDLLSVQTIATPMSDDPNERHYHIKGGKWLINNSYHAEYHSVVAKLDHDADGPKALSIFVVPRSSTKNWQRLETHVLRNMVLTKFEIDGPGVLVGKIGQGLQILQRMSMPAKYICSYLGMRLIIPAVQATIDHLSTKKIFGNNPVNFSNVYRQLYNLALQASFLTFTFYRAAAFSDSSFLQFHGTMLKSWLLLRGNELLCQNLLVAGSKGFLRESIIGRNAIDSFVLPVFDGHYTLNTLMTEKQMARYLAATKKADWQERHAEMRERMYLSIPGNQMNIKSSVYRNPDFYDYADYVAQINAPLNIDGHALIGSVRTLVAEIAALGLDGDAEYKYKQGTLVHWLESLLSALDMWKFYEDDTFLNVIIQQYNSIAKTFNDIIIEGNLQTELLTPMRQLPIPQTDDPVGFLRRIMDIEERHHLAQRQLVM